MARKPDRRGQIARTARRDDPVEAPGRESDPTDPDSALYETALLPGPKAKLGGPTFREWLDAA